MVDVEAMGNPSIRLREVAWLLPKPLYDALATLQQSLRGRDLQPAWGSVEALAIHFLTVAVREAHKEIATKQRSERLIKLPGEV